MGLNLRLVDLGVERLDSDFDWIDFVDCCKCTVILLRAYIVKPDKNFGSARISLIRQVKGKRSKYYSELKWC